MQRFLDFDYVSFFAHDASGEAAGAAGETEQGRDLQQHLEDDTDLQKSPRQEHEQKQQVGDVSHGAAVEAAGAAGDNTRKRRAPWWEALEAEQGRARRDLQEHLRDDDQPMNQSPSQEHEQEAQEIPTVRAPRTPRPRGPGGRERRPRGGQNRDVWKSYFSR